MSRRKQNALPVEQLELRILPTVKVNFNPNSGLLKITGDSADNDVAVDGLATAGSLEVFLDNALFDDYSGVKSLKINLKGGNDKLRMSALDFSSDVNLKFGSGADVLDLDSFTELGSGGNGPTHIGGFFKANFGGDEGDFAEMTNGVTIDGDVLLEGAADARLLGEGSSPQGELGLDLYFRSDFTLQLSGFGDADNDARELFAINLYIQGETLIKASGRAETFMILTSRFDGNLSVLMDDGDDELFIDFPVNQNNEFGSGVIFDGGDDADTLFLGSNNIFSGGAPVITSFETIN